MTFTLTARMSALLCTAAFLNVPVAAFAQDTEQAALQAEQTVAPADPIYNADEKSISELDDLLASGALTSAELVRSYRQRIEAIDRDGYQLNAVIALMPDALEQADMLDAERKAGKVRGPMHGIPVLIKDNIEVSGPVPTTAGSTAFLDNVTNRDAPMVKRLKDAGAIILGKTNLSQWANIRSSHSTSGWSSVGGLVKNPYALDRNACGSSSGSGVAAAASLAAAAIGTETDGSITCPAALNGLVGFKPTVGMVSRTYIVPISHSQDTAGPMTRNVRDAAILLTAMAGSDLKDVATNDADTYATDFTQGLSAEYLKGIRIGVMRDRISDDNNIQAIFGEALQQLKSAGAVLVDIADTKTGLEDVGENEFTVLMYELKADMNAYLATLPETVKSRTLADLIAFDNTHSAEELRWFGQDLFELAQNKGDLNSAEYKAAAETAKALAGPSGIDRLMRENKVKFLIGPSNGPAWVSDIVNGDNFSGPSQSELPAVAGYPHITVPMGYIEGLPIGLSVIGTKWADHDVLKAGYAFEQMSKAREKPTYRSKVEVLSYEGAAK